jgi:hypothetical protein
MLLALSSRQRQLAGAPRTPSTRTAVGAVAACDVQQRQDRRLAGGEIDGLHRARGSGQRQEAVHLSEPPNEDETASFAAGAATRDDERADAGSIHAREAAKVDYHEPFAPVAWRTLCSSRGAVMRFNSPATQTHAAPRTLVPDVQPNAGSPSCGERDLTGV